MMEFHYQRAENTAQALAMASQQAQAKYLGGGTNLVDLMREEIEAPRHLVDVSGLERNITVRADGSVLIDAAVTNTALACDTTIRASYPMLARAVLSGASAQIRNMATVAGNLMQRTRCYYFYDEAARCNKRSPGAGCDALGGFNRIHAILGASDHCIATHPSDLCVALAALDAVVHCIGPQGARSVKLTDFYRWPGDRPDLETVLQPAELITGIELPPPAPGWSSTYRKVRDRASYAFALVAVAAAIEVVDGKVAGVRLALGGVAHKPWRALAAEAWLSGKPASEEIFRAAADQELKVAQGLPHNAFKIELAARTIAATLAALVKGEPV